MNEEIKEKIVERLWSRFKSPLGNSSIDAKNNSMYILEAFLDKAMDEVEKETIKKLQE